MNQHAHNHHHQHDHGHHQTPWLKRAHKDWKTWVVVGLMLAGMIIYIMSNDESIQPGGQIEQPVPAAP